MAECMRDTVGNQHASYGGDKIFRNFIDETCSFLYPQGPHSFSVVLLRVGCEVTYSCGRMTSQL